MWQSRARLCKDWIEGTSQLTDPLTKRKEDSTLLRQTLEVGEHGITSDSAAWKPREGNRRRCKTAPNYSCFTDCCFTGLDIYEMDVIGGQHHDYEQDDQKYGPEAYRRIREAQEKIGSLGPTTVAQSLCARDRRDSFCFKGG